MNRLKEKLENVKQTVTRYPLLVIILLGVFIVNWMMIEQTYFKYGTLQRTLIIAVLLNIVAQLVYERFFKQPKDRMLLYGAALSLSVGFYFLLKGTALTDDQKDIQTGVLFFALWIAMIWVPTIKHRLTFNRSFIVVFKAFFTTLLFTFVMSLGLSIIIFTIDNLLFPLPFEFFSHTLNIIITIFSPLFFLSLIPVYGGRFYRLNEQQEERVASATSIPLILERLLTYIIVPLVSIYTIVVTIYILMNIGQAFWSNDLLESILITYIAIVVIVIILISEVDQPFVIMFRKILPKVLLPIVALQMISSLLSIGDVGITHGRYFVLVFGIFAMITSVLYSFFTKHQQGWIAVAFIVLSLLSILPPTDAFTVSRVNHVQALEKVLIKNGMFENHQVTASSEVSIHDQEKISQFVEYIDQMNYTQKISWLPSNIMYLHNFEQFFGFQPFPERNMNTGTYQSSSLPYNQMVINVSDYHHVIPLSVSTYNGKEGMTENNSFTHEQKTYQVSTHMAKEEIIISLKENNEVLGELNVIDVFDEVLTHGNELTLEQATVTKTYERFNLSIVVSLVNRGSQDYDGDIYILIEVKE